MLPLVPMAVEASPPPATALTPPDPRATASTAENPASVPAPPTAPGAHLHDGFYFRLGLGATYVWMNGSGPSGSATAGGGGVGESIAFGGTPVKGLVIAAAAMAHIADSSYDRGGQHVSGLGTLLAGTYGVLVDWFPDPSGGWHVGGSLGLALVGLADTSGLSAGASLLGGYDFWVAPQWSLGALLVATSALPTSMQDASGVASGYRLAPATLALEATVLCH